MLACMEGATVNLWKEALLNRRATLLVTGQPLPPIFTSWADFLVEFQGRFLNPNEIENARRALMALKQNRSAREFAQQFAQLAQQAGVTGKDFLPNQFRRSLKSKVQEKLLRQNFPDLQALQIATIEWDNSLFKFRKQQRAQILPRRLPPRPQPAKPANGTPMDLDSTRLSQEETKRRLDNRLCFCCRKPRHMGRNCLNGREGGGRNP